MRAPIVIAAAVVVFLAFGGYLVFARSASGGGVPRTVAVTVVGTRMTPRVISVHRGDRVTMNVTVDKQEEIHLHGYDIKFEAARAGDTVSHTFTADKTGNFDIEIEDTGTGLGSLQVTPG